MKDKKLVNLVGLARDLRLPVSWLKAEALAGRIPCLKVGRRLRFNKKAVENTLAKRAETGENGDGLQRG